METLKQGWGNNKCGGGGESRKESRKVSLNYCSALYLFIFEQQRKKKYDLYRTNVFSLRLFKTRFLLTYPYSFFFLFILQFRLLQLPILWKIVIYIFYLSFIRYLFSHLGIFCISMLGYFNFSHIYMSLNFPSHHAYILL